MKMTQCPVRLILRIFKPNIFIAANRQEDQNLNDVAALHAEFEKVAALHAEFANFLPARTPLPTPTLNIGAYFWVTVFQVPKNKHRLDNSRKFFLKQTDSRTRISNFFTLKRCGKPTGGQKSMPVKHLRTISCPSCEVCEFPTRSDPITNPKTQNRWRTFG